MVIDSIDDPNRRLGMCFLKPSTHPDPNIRAIQDSETENRFVGFAFVVAKDAMKVILCFKKG